MKTTIDRAGRVVIPKSLRLEVGLLPGDVEIVVDGAGLRVTPVATDELIETDGLLMLPDGPPLDADEVRELRLADQR